MRRVVLAALSGILLVGSVAADSPHSGRPTRLAGLQSAAQIWTDTNGIAHVRADHEEDLIFLQGWTHAQDRLFQMDFNRRQGSGTLAELLGAGALPADVQLRTLGLRRAAERSLNAISPRARRLLEAYAAGVNAWVAHHDLPPEYGALELTHFEPWTAQDSLAVTKLIAFGLSFDLGDIQRTVDLLTLIEAGNMLGFDGTALYFEDLFRTAPFDPASTVPDAMMTKSAGLAEDAPVSTARSLAPAEQIALSIGMAERYLQRINRVPFLQRLTRGGSERGSNEWAVSGEHTASGLPLMANDPHLSLDTPSTFYPIHLMGAGFDVTGNGFAGVPFVITGHNQHIAWGATVNPLDVTDVFQEQVVPDPNSPSGLSTMYLGELEPIIPIPETFRANQLGDGIYDHIAVVPPAAGVPEFTLIVPRRMMGPIVELDMATGMALSIQYTGWGATREVETFLAWDQAEGLDDFIEGLQYFDFGSQNWVYSDTAGNIAYFTSAEMPVREDLQAMTVNGLPPWFIRSGSGGNEWLPVQNPQPGQATPHEILPQDEMPMLVNPPAGWFVNANNDPAGNTLDNDPLNQLRPGGGIYYLSPGYDGFRGGRLTQRMREKLAGGGKVSFHDMQELQADNGLIDAQFFVPYIVTALERAQADGADPALAAFAENEGLVQAVSRLAGWDFTTPTGIPGGFDASDVDGQLIEPPDHEAQASIAATIYAVWRGQFIRNVIDTKLDPYGLPTPGSSQSLTALRTLLERFPVLSGVGVSGVDFFPLAGVPAAEDRRDATILGSLAAALERLAGEPFAPVFGMSTEQDDYRWGMLHWIVFDHPLGGPFNVPPAGGAFLPTMDGIPGLPTDGGFGVPDASHHNPRAQDAAGFTFGNGPANRFVGEIRDGRMRAESAWPGGTSGVLGSPYLVNLLPYWLTNDTVSLLVRTDEIQHHLGSVQKFVPCRHCAAGPNNGNAGNGKPGRGGPGVRGKRWRDRL